MLWISILALFPTKIHLILYDSRRNTIDLVPLLHVDATESTTHKGLDSVRNANQDTFNQDSELTVPFRVLCNFYIVTQPSTP